MSDKFSSIESQASYGIGWQMGEQLKSNPFDGLTLDAVVEGLRDAFNGEGQQVDNEQLRDAFGAIHQRMQAEKADKNKEVIAANEAFLADNAKREEVTVTESGLQYEVVEAGSGDKPAADSTVRVHYHGELIDGTVFDSSYQRGQPAEFPVNGVIRGWTEALQMMPVGAKWRLYIPSQLAYGEQGAGAAIKPYSSLVFDVELLDILG
ncbi:FKBP-type peptidyl-prolyl cis-trans isomerase [Alteromonas sp. ASW11-130]|uniref:FKBP-type peptidyl-prolyl cis-trans isomerase n=1 Tax=Alteromonas sp. ASW11-130 TaxID=3015775 RepID=UPI0022425F92|nr:FKBP-type peptidyl-prolyl cis-trans isomerase [Alteromonas sp. ASW11-130]